MKDYPELENRDLQAVETGQKSEELDMDSTAANSSATSTTIGFGRGLKKLYQSELEMNESQILDKKIMYHRELDKQVEEKRRIKVADETRKSGGDYIQQRSKGNKSIEDGEVKAMIFQTFGACCSEQRVSNTSTFHTRSKLLQRLSSKKTSALVVPTEQSLQELEKKRANQALLRRNLMEQIIERKKRFAEEHRKQQEQEHQEEVRIQKELGELNQFHSRRLSGEQEMKDNPSYSRNSKAASRLIRECVFFPNAKTIKDNDGDIEDSIQSSLMQSCDLAQAYSSHQPKSRALAEDRKKSLNINSTADNQNFSTLDDSSAKSVSSNKDSFESFQVNSIEEYPFAKLKYRVSGVEKQDSSMTLRVPSLQQTSSQPSLNMPNQINNNGVSFSPDSEPSIACSSTWIPLDSDKSLYGRRKFHPEALQLENGSTYKSISVRGISAGGAQGQLETNELSVEKPLPCTSRYFVYIARKARFYGQEKLDEASEPTQQNLTT